MPLIFRYINIKNGPPSPPQRTRPPTKKSVFFNCVWLGVAKIQYRLQVSRTIQCATYNAGG